MAISTIATFAANLAMVAFAPPSTYADMAILTVTVVMIANAVRLGADRIFVGEYHAACSRAGTRAGRQLGADILAFSLLSAVAGSLIVSATPIADLLSHALAQPLAPVERGLVGLWLGSEAVRLVVGESHRARFNFKFATFSSYGVRAPLFAILIVVAHELGITLDRTTLLACAALSSASVLVVSLAAASRRYHWWRHVPYRTPRRLIKGHMTMLITTFSAGLIGGADVWIAGATLTRATTASYGLSVAIVGGLATLSNAITGGLSPYIAQAIAESRSRTMQASIVRYVRITTALACAGYAAIVLLAPKVAVYLGGSSYVDVLPFVAILGAGQVISTGAGLSGSVLVVARKYKIVAIATVSIAAYAVVAESVVSFGMRQALLLAAASASATALLPVVNNVALARTLGGMRTDLTAKSTARH